MTASIDKKIVEMAFENDKFEKGVGTSLSTIDKLKKSLNFGNAGKSFDDINHAASRVNLGGISDGLSKLTGGFSALSIIGITALAKLASSAIDAGVKIARALVIDPIKTGLNEYETKLNSVQTILANTAKEGTNLEIVTKALNDLNTYSDKTIYNFQQMARNIGTFTAAGVKLDTSVTAIKGIANLAAISGSNADQASTAMYQLSQALSTGTVRLMDWNSVVNAGMGGQVFQDAVMETARVHGVAIDQIIAEEGSFRDSLQRGWFSSEILTETLSKFTGDLNAEQLKTMGYTEDQIAGIIKMGQTASDAATKVKTFTQLFGTLKEAAQSGWAQTWEIIVGDFEEAKAFLTTLNNWAGAIIGAAADTRNALVGGWSDLGGRTKLIEALQNVLNGIISRISVIKDAFREFFPPVTAEQLFKITELITNLTKKFILFEDEADSIRRIFKGVFAIFDIGRMFVVALAKEFFGLGASLKTPAREIGHLILRLADWIVTLRDSIKANDTFGKVMKTIGDTIRLIAGVISQGLSTFVAAVNKFKELDKTQNFFKAFLGGIKAFFESFKNLDFGILSDFIDRLKTRFAPLAKLGDFFKGASSSIGGAASPFIEKLLLIASNIRKAIGKFVLGVLDNLSKIDFSNMNFNKVFDGINGGLLSALLFSITRFVNKGSGLFGGIMDIFKNVAGFAENANGILAGITTVMTGVKDIMTAWQQQIRAGILLKIAGAIAILSVSLIALSLVDSEKLTGALASITLLFSNLFGAMAVYEKVSGGTAGIPAMAKGIGGMLGLATAVLILSGALVNLSKVPSEDIVKGVLAITTLSGVLVGVSIALAKNQAGAIKGAGSMVIFSLALRALIGPIKTLGAIDTGALTQGLAGLAVMLAEIGIFMKGMNSSVSDFDDIIGLLVLSGAIQVLSSVIDQLGRLDASVITQGLTVLGVLMAGLATFSRGATGGGAFILTAAGMLVLSGAMEVMADVLNKIGQLSWEELTVSLAGLGGSLLIMATALNAMAGGMPGALALLVAAGALVVLVPPLKALGNMSLEQIGLSLLAMAGAFTVLGLAASILTPLLPSLFALGGAMALIGIAALGVGVGIAAFSGGLAALAVTGAAGGAAVAALLLAISAVIPVLATAAAVGLVQFAKTIEEGAPTIFAAGRALMKGFFESIALSIPTIIDIVITFVQTLLTSIEEHMPEIIQSGYNIMVSFLTGVRRNIADVVPLAIDVVTKFLDAISAKLPELVDSGWKMVISFIDSMTAAVEEHLPTLITSVQKLGIAIITGVVQGLLDGRQNAIEGIKELGRIIIESFKERLGIHSPSDVFMALAVEIINGLINGIRNNISLAVSAITDLGNRLINNAKGNIANMYNVGKDLVLGLGRGIKDFVSEAVKQAAEMAKAVLEKISSVFDEHSPSKETTDIGMNVDKGLANGINKFANLVVGSAQNLGDKTLSGFNAIISKVSDSLNSNLDFNPSIRPVMDLTDIQTGASQIDGMLGDKTLNVAGIAARAANAVTIDPSAPEVTDPSLQPATAAPITFIQNNTSPKELSRIEIYRQTKNQLLQAKGLVGEQ